MNILNRGQLREGDIGKKVDDISQSKRRSRL